jgi:hypothetical protein
VNAGYDENRWDRIRPPSPRKKASSRSIQFCALSGSRGGEYEDSLLEAPCNLVEIGRRFRGALLSPQPR